MADVVVIVILLAGSLITGTGMGSFTGMEVGRGRREEAGTGTVQGGEREALVVEEKEARRGGRGLSSGTENVRRRKREEHKHNSNCSCCNVVGSAVCFSLRLLNHLVVLIW